jgi:hypothetical protein
MDWKSLASRKDPVEQRRRELEEQARNLQKQKARLEQLLDAQRELAEASQNGSRPAVWRAQPEESYMRRQEGPANRPTRVLQAQRKRDRNIFILLAAALLGLLFVLVRAMLG